MGVPVGSGSRPRLEEFRFRPNHVRGHFLRSRAVRGRLRPSISRGPGTSRCDHGLTTLSLPTTFVQFDRRLLVVTPCHVGLSPASMLFDRPAMGTRGAPTIHTLVRPGLRRGSPSRRSRSDSHGSHPRCRRFLRLGPRPLYRTGDLHRRPAAGPRSAPSRRRLLAPQSRDRGRAVQRRGPRRPTRPDGTRRPPFGGRPDDLGLHPVLHRTAGRSPPHSAVDHPGRSDRRRSQLQPPQADPATGATSRPPIACSIAPRPPSR